MHRTVLVFFVLALVFSGCRRDQTQNSNCQNCPVVSFTNDIIPIFTQNCANAAGCHTSVGTAGRLNLEPAVAYANATSRGTGYVNPGNPISSVLLGQLYPGSPNHMPLTGQLDPCTIQEIYCWIQQGALNN